ncbi:DUF7331 family protein [Natrinema saccharevitans]|nr:hypothetical protein [Natrinema saccharevitans]
MPDKTRGSNGVAEQETDDGTVRIFDTENDAAWLESDTTLSIAWQT